MAEAVRVLVRCRPMNAREKSLKCRKVIDIDTSRNSVSILPLKKDDTNPPKQFTFDGAYGDDSKTSTIYNEMAASLVENVIEGFNATVFAYGQTGCGKSYTMEGAEIDDNSSSNNLPENAGIIPRACTDLFDSVALAGNSKKFLVHASYVEIYNENVRDLLANGKGNSLELKEHPDSGVYVKGLTMHRVTTAASATKLMAKGWSSRMTGATLMNQDSSRSHAIFTIYVETEENENIRAGKLHLVDLAGSERQSKTQATGIRLKEAAKINLSLSALGNVISSLVDGKAKHIPYRDSKLTRILQDSLGGNTKTLMIACISPANDNYEETLSTLRYANRAKKIKNIPKINEDPKDALLRQYQDEIQELKKILQSQLGVDGLKDLIAKQKTNGSAKTVKQKQMETDEVNRKAFVSESSQSIELEQKLAQAIEMLNQESLRRKKAEKELKKLRKLQMQEDYMISESIQNDHENSTKNKSSESIENTDIVSKDKPRDQQKVSRTLSTLKIAETVSIHPQSLDTEFSRSNSMTPKLASQEHEAQLKRLMELQQGFVRSTHISESALESIRAKKEKIKKSQSLADKRRELAKKAVAAQDDEEMFQALFETVHTDLRSQQKSLEEAKLAIENLQQERVEDKDIFENEKNELFETLEKQKSEIKLLESILDRVQPMIKRDCNYSNIDKIKKDAVYDAKSESWILPEIRLRTDELPNVGAPSSRLSSRQMQLLNSRDSYTSRDSMSTMSSKVPRRLRPMNNFDF